jgi:glutathione S-transferase
MFTVYGMSDSGNCYKVKLALEQHSIADIALYAYTHCAGDGGFDMKAYPALGAWLERVRAQPRHVPMA